MSQIPFPETTPPFWDRKWFLWLVFGGFALLYLLNRSPHVGFNDGLSFLYSAAKGFDGATNATSHFLYNNLQHLLLKAFFFLPHVWVLTLFSIGCSLCTLLLVYRVARLLTQRQGLALLPVVVLGISFTFWQQTEIIEVYAFNNLLFAAFLHVSLRDIVGKRRRNYLLVSILLGLGLLTHIQHILSIPFFLGYLWWRNDLRLGQKILGMLPWMLLMSILFLLPAVTGLHTWKAVFFESKFQDELLGVDAWALLKGVLLGFGMLVYNFQLTLLPIAMGWRKLWKLDRGLTIWLMALALPYLAFALKYSVNDNHVFYLCFYIVLVLPLVHFLGNELDGKSRHLRWIFPAALILPVVLYALATLLAPNLGLLAHYDSEKAFKGGVVHLLWPGKAWARDPLEIAWREAHLCQADPQDKIGEWNFEAAVGYLKLQCPGGIPQNGWTIYPPLSASVDSCFFDCPELFNLRQKFPTR
ncbi:MAG TPA: glycosyltransferase family 39 protein [Bacteroidia bacterium]|nr:glycosyltransferase family 39 protein [Bacteroidia bacterium]